MTQFVLRNWRHCNKFTEKTTDDRFIHTWIKQRFSLPVNMWNGNVPISYGRFGRCEKNCSRCIRFSDPAGSLAILVTFSGMNVPYFLMHYTGKTDRLRAVLFIIFAISLSFTLINNMFELINQCPRRANSESTIDAAIPTFRDSIPLVWEVNLGMTSFVVTYGIKSSEIPFDSLPRSITPLLPRGCL